MTSYGNKEGGGRAKRRFLIAGETGHSEYWRRDKSPVEMLELAKLLHGIRKVVSRVGRNTGSVVWEGMAGNGDGIALDPTPIIGSYPVPADKADVAVGLAVRGAFQKTQWSDHVKKTASARFDFPPVYAYKFSLFLDMAEKVYADIVSNRSVFGMYTEKARIWESEKAARQFISPPSFAELLHLWWQMAADREQDAFRHAYQDRSVVQMAGRTALGQFYTKPLALLNGIVDGLIAQCSSLASVTQRCAYRLDLYASVFAELLPLVKFWPGDRRDPFLLSAAFREDMATEDAGRDAARATLLAYASEIEQNLQGKQVDFTQQVKSLVANFGEVARVEGNDMVMPSKNVVDRALLYKLTTVLQSVSQRNVSYSRGLASGRIDRSRLFRAPTTGCIFNLKKSRFELQNDIVLLVDCTGSMAEPNKWAKAEVVYQTLFTALAAYNPRARIFAYNERKDTCRLTEICRQGKFFSVMPHGRTASGEAIIATALSLKTGCRKPFIVHLTDGASNWGCGVPDALRYCRGRGIHLLTLGLECDPMNKTALSEEYGAAIEFMDHVGELPGLFKHLLTASKYAGPAKKRHSDEAGILRS